MIVMLTALACLAIGAGMAARREARLCERITIAAVIACTLWLGSTWLLALTAQLTKAALAMRAVLFCAAAVVLLRRVRIRLDRRRPAIVATLALLPLLIFVEFILWRGVILPPVSHDALAYHLPKAVLWARAHGFEYLRELDPRQRNIPANYELLLTEFIVTQQSDTWTEWPSAAFYLLFAIACAAMAERWWPGLGARERLAVLLFAAGIPVLVLHAGAHKNDTMMAFFTAAAMLFAGRFLARAELDSLLLAIAATALAIGTKPQAAAVALFLAPFLLWRLVRVHSPRRIAAVFAFGAAAFLLLGGAVYVVNMLEERSVVGTYAPRASVITYGDWRNLWEAPYVLLIAPFSRDAMQLSVPWEAHPWFWRRYELYFSHLGIPFAVCAVALPFALLRKREWSVERTAVSLAAFAAFLVLLPVVFYPHGMFAISLPRYALFVVPVVFAWTVAPAAMRWPRALLAIAMASFVFYAIDNIRHDAFAPPDFVMWAREHPGTRQIPFDSGRAATIVDLRAKPDDTIAFDAGYGSWIHPAFGANFTRTVHFIPPDGPVVIPDDADWVVIDRTWSVIWDVPGFNDLSQVRQFIGRGKPKPEDLRVRLAVMRDPRFRQVYSRRGENQVVFRRVR